EGDGGAVDLAGAVGGDGQGLGLDLQRTVDVADVVILEAGAGGVAGRDRIRRTAHLGGRGGAGAGEVDGVDRVGVDQAVRREFGPVEDDGFAVGLAGAVSGDRGGLLGDRQL